MAVNNPGVTRSRQKVLIVARMTDSSNSGGERTRGRKSDALRSGGNAVWQVNIPPPFTGIHFQHNAGIAGRVVACGMDDDIIRAHLRNRDGIPVKKQLHSYDGGMSATTGF